MRKIKVVTFMTMDGVLQSPGGPEEDPSNGFVWGGWQASYWDEALTRALSRIMASPFDLLLGRKTYEIFAAHWPYQDDEISEVFNRVNKYVVATTAVDLSWQNSILIDGDVVNRLEEIRKGNGPDLLVHGSGKLAQTLFANNLVDVLDTWIFPITIGKGKKLFEEGTSPQQWKLTESLISPRGAIVASYVPDGSIKKGSFVPDKVSEAELARREKWRSE